MSVNSVLLRKVEDVRGNLSVIEEMSNIPFEIRRVYWIYDVPGGEIRGSHALRNTDEFIVALSGSFDVVLKSNKCKENFSLNRSYKGIYVPRMTWRTLENFSTNSIALVLASGEYDSKEYIRDHDEFLDLMGT